ncbi:hypothetical protein EV121DRAFT_210529 [Schizophyllum commune]
MSKAPARFSLRIPPARRPNRPAPPPAPSQAPPGTVPPRLQPRSTPVASSTSATASASHDTSWRAPPPPSSGAASELDRSSSPEHPEALRVEESSESDEGKARGRKRTIDAINDTLDSMRERGSKRPTVSDRTSPLHPYLHASRYIPRVVPDVLFYSFKAIIYVGMEEYGHTHDPTGDDDPAFMATDPENDKATKSCMLSAYNHIMTLLPGFSECLQEMPEHNIKSLIKEMEKIMSSVRSDDTNLCRTLVLEAILKNPRENKLDPMLLPQDSKELRGYNHPQFARLLIPHAYYNALVNPETHHETKEAIEAHELELGNESLSMVLWDPEEYNLEDEEKGMMRSPLLVRLYRAIFFGKKHTWKAPGALPPRSYAKAHGHKRVTGPSIAYVAMQARFACSAVAEWQLEDSDDWNMHVFYKNIVEILEQDEDDPDEWVEETMRWWNIQIYGKPEGFEDDKPVAVEEVSIELDGARARRRARAAKRAAARRAASTT